MASFHQKCQIIEVISDGRLGLDRRVLSLGEDGLSYVLLFPDGVRAAPPSPAVVQIDGVFIEQATDISPSVVYVSEVRGALAAELFLPDAMMRAWRLAPDNRVLAIERLLRIPPKYFGNRAHGILRSTARAAVWDPAGRAACIKRWGMGLALTNVAMFAGSIGPATHQWLVDYVQHAAAAIREVIELSSKGDPAARTEAAVEADAELYSAYIEEDEAELSPQDDDTTRLSPDRGGASDRSGEPSGHNASNGASGGGGRSASPRKLAFTGAKADQLLSPRDVASLIGDDFSGSQDFDEKPPSSGAVSSGDPWEGGLNDMGSGRHEDHLAADAFSRMDGETADKQEEPAEKSKKRQKKGASAGASVSARRKAKVRSPGMR